MIWSWPVYTAMVPELQTTSEMREQARGPGQY